MSCINIQKVVDNELCFGCGTCNVACPVKAIHMEFSSIGRLLPKVNENTCTHCGMCMKLCPGVDVSGQLSSKIESTLMGEAREVLFGRSTNDEYFTNAQSGGATTETLAFLFDERLIDAALVVVQEKHYAKYRVVSTKQELAVSQTSQYTPIDLVSGLPLIQGYNHVAVVGTPCHIEGVIKLKEQFPKRYSNVDYLLGLICAGTQSQISFDIVKRIGESKIGKIDESDQVRWRQKKYSNYKRADIAIVSTDGKVRMLDNNIRHTAKHYLTSPRCRLCFDKMNLYADIVYGDAWGVSGDDTKNGGNVIICRTDKGVSLINEMIKKGRLIGRQCPIEEISKGQGMLKKYKTVNAMLALYQQKAYLLPGWAEGSIFDKDTRIPKSLQKEVYDFFTRDKKTTTNIVSEISNKIKIELYIKKIQKLIKRIIR